MDEKKFVMKTDNVKKKEDLYTYLYSILYLLLLVNWTFIFSSHRVILSESTNCHSDTENIGTYEITF